MGGALTDIVPPAVRSRMMAGIRGEDTVPERVVRGLLHGAGFRFRLHPSELPGRPDIVLPSRRVAVFVHGCFWHQHSGCRFAKLPGTNEKFWSAKLATNRERDTRSEAQLLQQGWRVLVVWECTIRGSTDKLGALRQRLSAWILSKRRRGEFPRTVHGSRSWRGTGRCVTDLCR